LKFNSSITAIAADVDVSLPHTGTRRRSDVGTWVFIEGQSARLTGTRRRTLA
jgi:hypothetical protein